MYRRYRRKWGSTQDFHIFFTVVGLSVQVGLLVFIIPERIGHSRN